MNNNILVSVCIPCYNAEKTIEKTILSVLNQTYSNIELIICDNKSTDNTVQIIHSISDSRLKLFKNETNIGIVLNFQKSLSHATGQYVKMLCADDIISSDCIEKQLNAFIKNKDKNISIVVSEKEVINENNKKLFVKRFPGKEGFYDGENLIKMCLIRGTNIFGEPGCVLFDNEIAKRTSGFIIEEELTYVVDLNFYCQLLKKGNLIVLKEPLFSFRIINTSGTAGFKWKQARIFNKLIDKYHKENFIKLTFMYRSFGKLMSWIMCLARNLIFKFAN